MTETEPAYRNYLITEAQARTLKIILGDQTVITIHPDGRVEAPSLEAAGEAGRVFVQHAFGATEAIRQHQIQKDARIAYEAVLRWFATDTLPEDDTSCSADVRDAIRKQWEGE